jgi:hypothetical protein
MRRSAQALERRIYAAVKNCCRAPPVSLGLLSLWTRTESPAELGGVLTFYIRGWLLAYALSGAIPFPAAAAQPPLFRDFMGLNGHTVQFRPQLYKPVATLARDYHPAEWDLGTNSNFIPPFPFARNRVDWQQVYGSWRSAGWRTDACVMFENDEDLPQVHGSSGLTRHFQPKPAFHAAAHLQRTLADYRFDQVLINRPGEAFLYEFCHGKDPKRRVWVAWSPTGSNRTSALDLPDPGGIIAHAEPMPLREGHALSLPVEPGVRHVPISESPLYLFVVRR